MRILRFHLVVATVALIVLCGACSSPRLTPPEVERTPTATPTVLATALSESPQLAPPLTGHTNWVTYLVFSRDGKMLASGSDDGAVILWDVGNPMSPVQVSPPLGDYKCCVEGIALSPDGQILATSTLTNTVAPIEIIVFWDVSDPRAPTRLGALHGHKDGVLSVAFSPDGNTLATGSSDQTIILWDVSKPKLAALPSVPTPIPAIACPATAEEEEYAVYSALISDKFGGGGGTVVIVDHTVGEYGKKMDSMPGLDPEALTNYIARNHQPCTLYSQAFKLAGKVALISSSAYPGLDGWGEFYNQYPGSTGIIDVSRVGFNASRDKAFVYAGQMKGDLYGTGYCFTLEKKNGRWVVVDYEQVWIS
jgi:hypothetical protein